MGGGISHHERPKSAKASPRRSSEGDAVSMMDGEKVKRESLIASTKSYKPESEFDKKVIATLRRMNKERLQNDKGNRSVMNRVLLNFPKMQITFTELHNLFVETDTDRSGSLEIGELHALMQKMNPEITRETVSEIFQEADVFTDSKINFKEFLTCLALGYLLNLIPELRPSALSSPRLVDNSKMEVSEPTEKIPENDDVSTFPKGDLDVSNVVGGSMKVKSGKKWSQKRAKVFHDVKGVRRVFELATELYLEFDTSCTGTITFREMERVINSTTGESEMTKDTIDSRKRRNSLHGTPGSELKRRNSLPGIQPADEEEPKKPAPKHQDSTSPMADLLSRDRWKELDWDSDGFITYQEFLCTYVKWVASLSDEKLFDSDDDDDE